MNTRTLVSLILTWIRSKIWCSARSLLKKFTILWEFYTIFMQQKTFFWVMSAPAQTPSCSCSMFNRKFWCLSSLDAWKIYKFDRCSEVDAFEIWWVCTHWFKAEYLPWSPVNYFIHLGIFFIENSNPNFQCLFPLLFQTKSVKRKGEKEKLTTALELL